MAESLEKTAANLEFETKLKVETMIKELQRSSARDIQRASARDILFIRISMILAFIGVSFMCITLLQIRPDYYPLMLNRDVIISFSVCSFVAILTIFYLIWKDHDTANLWPAAVGGDLIDWWIVVCGSWLCNYVFTIGLRSLFWCNKDGDGFLFSNYVVIALQITFFLKLFIDFGYKTKPKEQSGQEEGSVHFGYKTKPKEQSGQEEGSGQC